MGSKGLTPKDPSRKPYMMTCAYNPSMEDVETGGLLEFAASQSGRTAEIQVQ